VIRLSVTDLESYRHWRERDDQDLVALVERLRGVSEPTPQMEAGKAFAKLMENAIEGTAMVERTVTPWTFDFTGLDTTLEIPPVRELKGEWLLHTSSGPVTLVGKVDGLHGRRVHDQKLTERWDAERYLDSLQWRAYLVMFDAYAFTYDVFVARYNGNRINVTEYHPMTFYRYPAIEADVRRAVEDLARVVAEHVPEKVS
jgi:hypothetical protein